MANYFNTLPLRLQLEQLGVCEFMEQSEFADGIAALAGKKVVIVGCGAQGLNQGLNMRDSGLDISYALRADAIAEKRASYKNATENGFTVGTYEELIPTADLVCNLTPDKQHTAVVNAIMPLMKKQSSFTSPKSHTNNNGVSSRKRYLQLLSTTHFRFLKITKRVSPKTRILKIPISQIPKSNETDLQTQSRCWNRFSSHRSF